MKLIDQGKLEVAALGARELVMAFPETKAGKEAAKMLEPLGKYPPGGGVGGNFRYKNLGLCRQEPALLNLCEAEEPYQAESVRWGQSATLLRRRKLDGVMGECALVYSFRV